LVIRHHAARPFFFGQRVVDEAGMESGLRFSRYDSRALMKTRCARICSVAAVGIGATSLLFSVIGAVLFVVLGPGREAYVRLNTLLGLHGYLMLAVLPFAAAAFCLGRIRSGLLAFALCLFSWGHRGAGGRLLSRRPAAT
jgi:hypothetical protein